MRVCDSGSRQSWGLKSKHTPGAVRRLLSFARIARDHDTIARATFDGTPNSVLKPRPRWIFELKALYMGCTSRERFDVCSLPRLFRQSYIIYI